MPKNKDFESDDLDPFFLDDLALSNKEMVKKSQEDQYGVWVKAEIETSDKKDESFSASSMEEGPLLGEDDFLSSEELVKLDDQFDLMNIEEPQQPPTTDFEEIVLDDFVNFDEETSSFVQNPEDKFSESLEDISFQDVIQEESREEKEDIPDKGQTSSVILSQIKERIEDVNLFDFIDEDSFSSVDTVSMNTEPKDEMDMDRLLALEADLTSGIRDKVEGLRLSSKVSLKEDLVFFKEIQKEVASLKKEMTDLKQELMALKISPKSQPSKPQKNRGFFDEEEDDETIALTDDELDNILSNAEINDETKEGEKPDDSFFLASDDHLEISFDDKSLGNESPEEQVSVLAQEPELSIPAEVELENFILDKEEKELDQFFQDEPQDETSTTLGLEQELSLAPEEIELETPELGQEDSEFSRLTDEEALFTGDTFSLPQESFEDLHQGKPSNDSSTGQETPQLTTNLTPSIKEELKSILNYMDKLLASLPDDKIQEFAESEHFETYKKLFEELGLVD